jgi:hypothetical protein
VIGQVRFPFGGGEAVGTLGDEGVWTVEGVREEGDIRANLTALLNDAYAPRRFGGLGPASGASPSTHAVLATARQFKGQASFPSAPSRDSQQEVVY